MSTRQLATQHRVVSWITVAVLSCALGATPARAERELALVGATIYPAPGASAISNGIVIVRDGVIAAVGTRDDVSVRAKADVLDCSGLSLTAGFWNSHVHFMPWRLAVAGWLPGADGIKLFTGGLAAPGSVVVMDTEIVRAATTAAHERGAFVVAHPSNSAGARAAIEGGVDILAHTFPSGRDGPWDRSLLPRMKQAGMALIPTMKLWEYELRRAGRDRATIERWIQVAQDQVRSFAALGGPILFGTDVGYVREYNPTDEYAYLAGAGLSFAQILATLTTAPAERFKHATRTGRIAVGMDADLVTFEGDPRADIRSLARVRHVVHHGRLVSRDEASPRR
ncbi:MAG: amidohydrolase family protein [Candidatus Rokuibacteriota bacterium]